MSVAEWLPVQKKPYVPFPACDYIKAKKDVDTRRCTRTNTNPLESQSWLDTHHGDVTQHVLVKQCQMRKFKSDTSGTCVYLQKKRHRSHFFSLSLHLWPKNLVESHIAGWIPSECVPLSCLCGFTGSCFPERLTLPKASHLHRSLLLKTTMS